MLIRGPFNTWGYDRGIPAQMQHNDDGKWELEIMAQWPSYVQVNIFGYDDYFYGDMDGDGVIERLPPNSVVANYLNMSAPPQPVSIRVVSYQLCANATVLAPCLGTYD